MNQIEQSQIVLNEVFSGLNLPIVVLQQPMNGCDHALRFMRVTEDAEKRASKILMLPNRSPINCMVRCATSV